MNFLQRIYNSAVSYVKSAPYTFIPNYLYTPQWGARNYHTFMYEGFLINTLIYACIRLKYYTAAIADLKAYQVTEIDDTVELPRNSILQKLLRYPNPYMNYLQWMELNIKYLNVSGNCYLLKDTEMVKDERGFEYPSALWPVRPDKMRPVPVDGLLMGYVYTPNGFYGGEHVEKGEMKVFSPEQVIHIKYPNAIDPFNGLGEGLSPFFSGARVMDTDNSLTGFIKAFFDNAGIVSGILKTKMATDVREAKRIQEAWREKHSGQYGNQWEIAVLDADTEYQKTGLTMSEMAFEAIDFRNEARICQVLGVPPSLVGSVLGLTRNTYTNPREARQAWWQDLMMPEYQRFEYALAKVYEDINPNIVVKYDYSRVKALQSDLLDKAKTFSTLVRNGVPVNYAIKRTDLDIEAIEGGDVPLMSFSTVTLANITDSETTMTKEKKEEEVIIEDEPVEDNQEKMLEVKSLTNSLERDTYMIAFYPSPDVAKRLKVDGGTSVEHLHITVLLIEKPLPRKEKFNSLVHSVSLSLPSLFEEGMSGQIAGIGCFDTGSEEHPNFAHYANVDIPSLPKWREELLSNLEKLGYSIRKTRGYTPHITLLYSSEQRMIPIQKINLNLYQLSVVDGRFVTNINLSDGSIQETITLPEDISSELKIRGEPLKLGETEPTSAQLDQSLQFEREFWRRHPDLVGVLLQQEGVTD